MPSSVIRPLALITSASSGIGLEIAKQFSRRGYDLILVATDAVQLAQVAEQLRASADNPQVSCMAVELATYAGVEALYKAVSDMARPVDVLLISTAAETFAQGGRLAAELALLNTHITALVHLVERLVGGVVAHGTGKVLIASSLAASSLGPCHAVCEATRAFLRSFGQALRNDLQDAGISVAVLLPGPMEAPAFAQSAFAALEDEDRVIPALLSKLQAEIASQAKPHR